MDNTVSSDLKKIKKQKTSDNGSFLIEHSLIEEKASASEMTSMALSGR